MRYQIYNALVATGFLAMTAMDNPVLASPPDGKPFTLAQTQQPATPVPTTPAPAAGAQQDDRVRIGAARRVRPDGEQGHVRRGIGWGIAPMARPVRQIPDLNERDAVPVARGHGGNESLVRGQIGGWGIESRRTGR